MARGDRRVSRDRGGAGCPRRPSADRRAGVRDEPDRLVRLRAAIPPPGGGAPHRSSWPRSWRRSGARAGGSRQRGWGGGRLAASLTGQLLAPWIAVREAPHSPAAALGFLEARGIPAVATTYWIGPRLSFESGERVVGVPLRGRPRSVSAAHSRRRAPERPVWRTRCSAGPPTSAAWRRGSGRSGISARADVARGARASSTVIRLPGVGRVAARARLGGARASSPRATARLRLAARLRGGRARRPRARPTWRPRPRGGAATRARTASTGWWRRYRAAGRSAEAATLAARRVEAFTPARAARGRLRRRRSGYLGFTLSGSAVARAGDRLAGSSPLVGPATAPGTGFSRRGPAERREAPGLRRTSAPLGGDPYPATTVAAGRGGAAFVRDLAIPAGPPGRASTRVRVRLWGPRRVERPAPRPRAAGRGRPLGPSGSR